MTDRTAALWVSMPIPAIIICAKNKIMDLNPAAEIFMNASSKVLLGTPVWDNLMVDAPLDEAVDRVRKNLAPLFISDVDVGTGNRAPVQCNLQIAPLVDAPDEILLLLNPREIAGRLGRSLQTKTSAKSAIGMAEMLAHEIKNPLAGITGAAQLIGMNLTGEDVELTDLIVAESRRIVTLLNQVEQFGNLRPPACQAINIHDILERARKSAIVGFASHMHVTESYDPSLPLTFADPDQLQQVFLNLYKNALESDSDPQKISLSVDLLSDKLIILISDAGGGMNEQQLQQALLPFYTTKSGGSGLGLSLCNEIVIAHNGLMRLQNNSNPGLDIRIILPL